MNKNVLLVILVIALIGILGYFTLVKKSASTGQPLINNSQNTQVVTSEVNQCGSISQKILTQYDYQPTETEKEATIKSLTCINQALIKCTPSSLAINNANQVTNITVKGQGKIGCDVSIQTNTGETMTCPLPSDYSVDVQKKFAISNYDGTIVKDLITNINAEISSGNKSGACTVTK